MLTARFRFLPRGTFCSRVKTAEKFTFIKNNRNLRYVLQFVELKAIEDLHWLNDATLLRFGDGGQTAADTELSVVFFTVIFYGILTNEESVCNLVI